MEKINSVSEGADTLITTHFRQGQLPWQVEQAISIAPEGEMRDMLLLSVLTTVPTHYPPCVCIMASHITCTAPNS